MITVSDPIPTPAGDFRLAERDGKVVALGFVDHFDGLLDKVAARWPDEQRAVGDTEFGPALEKYVAGDLDIIDSIPVDLGGTEFQARVWAALRTIPLGETWSYRQLAEAVGSPNGFRAVGSANGKNPVSIIVPCHRVVRNDGDLGGYGGGLPRKEWLLRHEGARLL